MILELLIFFRIAASLGNTAFVNRIGIKTVLANGLSTFFIDGSTAFSNGLKSLSRTYPFCTA